ncbi:MAG: right-handed parallel beta-helix repeat-containing protein [Nitrospira sp.]|jgi:parallel beta-helix repeat protein|nr:right-handed parallel beta-helix repeat-containing protein [Nitrospira sp. BO4]
MHEESIPANPLGGRTLIVDGTDPGCYPLPSAAIKDMGESDQVYVRPGIYEDKVFVSQRPVRLLGAGRDRVHIFWRRGGPLYLQEVPEGLITGMTFRYIGSDQHSAINVLNSTCLITQCRAMEGILSGVVLYGPECRAIFAENEVCRNRESGIFVFAGAQPRVADNRCLDNHHFGIAVRDQGSRPELVRNQCEGNMLSGILLFHHGGALMADNICQNNQHWGILLTPDSQPNPSPSELSMMNRLEPNPLGAYSVSDQPLAQIGR